MLFDELEAACREVRPRLNPPATEAALAAREQTWGVTLPEEARRIVLELGDGCPDGPAGYGMPRLGDPVADLDSEPDPAQPFPLTDMWVWESEDDADWTAVEAVWSRGWLPLGTDGCGQYPVLVVSGAERGEVWHLNEMGAFRHSGRRGLAGFMLDWLECGPWGCEITSGSLRVPQWVADGELDVNTSGDRVEVTLPGHDHRPAAVLARTGDGPVEGRWVAGVGIRREWVPGMRQATAEQLWSLVPPEFLDGNRRGLRLGPTGERPKRRRLFRRGR